MNKYKVDWIQMISRSIDMKFEAIFEAMSWTLDVCGSADALKSVNGEVRAVAHQPITKKRGRPKKVNDVAEVEQPTTKNVILKEETQPTYTELAKQFAKDLKLPAMEETLHISHSFKTKADITERTIMVAEAFGLGIDAEKEFTIYDDAQVKFKQEDIVYITGDSGSGKSWILKNIFAKMKNVISIDELKIDDNEVVVEGVGKDLNDALMKLNISGLGDAFLYLRKYSQLSDGQKYRYRIAKFIDHEDKDIWILDEFCATLDRVTAKVVAYNLQKIARKLNKTVIVATTHTDLLEEIRPTVHIVKGYESDIVTTYYDYSKDWGTLSFYKDIEVIRGKKEDYEQLKKFHYRQASLGALKQVYSCYYKEELVGVIVICYPHLALKGRNIALENRFSKMTKENCDILNKEFDSIARVIIHPKYRGIGLAQVMLKEYFKLTNATYTETLAVMANYNPFFEKAGMQKIDVDEDIKRAALVQQLEKFEFNTALISSARYCQSIFESLSEEQQAQVKTIVSGILVKYKGQIAKLFSQDASVEDLVEKHLFEVMKEIQRANTVYLIKQLK